jgi:hypothetical protein
VRLVETWEQTERFLATYLSRYSGAPRPAFSSSGFIAVRPSAHIVGTEMTMGYQSVSINSNAHNNNF